MSIKAMRTILRENGLPEKAAYFLLGIMFNIETDLLELQKQHINQLFKLGLLYFKDGVVNANLQINESITSVSANKESDMDRFRKLFKGVKPGAMGDANAVFEKMQRWRRVNPEFTFEEIINKTRNYIEYKKSVSEEKFIPQADYFIYKKDMKSGEEKSTLSAIIEEDFVVSEQYQAV